MEALKRLFKAKAEFVRSSEQEGNTPSDEQLGSFLRDLTQATGLAIRGAPPAVRLDFILVIVRLLNTITRYEVHATAECLALEVRGAC